MDKPADNADVEIIRRCLAGQRDAFAELVARYQRAVFGVAAHMLGDRDQADDAAQEVFVRAYSRLATFKGESSMRTWLLQITTRLCIDVLRARRRRPELMLEEQSSTPVDMDWESGVDYRHALAGAIAELPAHYKAVIVLRHLQHMPYSDMSRTLSLPLATVKTHLRRARLMLHARLEGALPGGAGPRPEEPGGESQDQELSS